MIKYKQQGFIDHQYNWVVVGEEEISKRTKRKIKQRLCTGYWERGNLEFVECPEFCGKSVFGLNNLNFVFCIVFFYEAK